MKKSLGFIHVFAIASGVMISSGIFILPGLAFERSGPSVIAAYMLAGLVAMAGILSLVELVTAMPKSGGDYFIIHRSLGSLVGTVAGMLTWFALTLKSAFAVVGLSEIAGQLTGITPEFLALGFTLLFVLINLLGVDFASKLEVGLVALLLGLLGAYALLGWTRVDPEAYTPFFSRGAQGFVSTIAFVFVSFGGLINVASIAEEVRNPRRNIPLGILISVGAITLIYGAVLYVSVGILPPAELESSLSPLADTGRMLAGSYGFAALNIAAVLAFVTTANAGILSAARYPLALSADRLLPGFLARSRGSVPVPALLLTGALMGGAIFLPLDLLVKSASAVILTTYILTNLSVLVLRSGRILNYRPSFRAPFYPYLQILSILLFLGLIVDLGWVSIEASAGFVLVSLGFYLFYGRKAARREYALLHWVERIINKRFTGHGLEEELREIVRRRDGIVDDGFDRLLREAVVLDLDREREYASLFRRAAEALGPRLGMSAAALNSALVEREESSSTVLDEFVAVPHVIVPGTERFQLALVRSRSGIRFRDERERVEAIFFLCGSEDRRTLHLQVLSTLARLVLTDGFREEWRSAKGPEQLRDLLLMGDRPRYRE